MPHGRGRLEIKSPAKISLDDVQGFVEAFSLITLLAHHLLGDDPLPVRSAAWYAKPEATFSDVIGFVRHFLWTHIEFVNSGGKPKPPPISNTVLHGLVETLCYAA